MSPKPVPKIKISILQRPLRVFSMNIYHVHEPYPQRKRLLRDGIRRLSPDVLAFQEAWLDGKQNQVAELLDGLGYNVFHQFESLPPRPSSHNGNAIASRWPIERLPVLSLQVTDRSQNDIYAAMPVKILAPDPVGPFLFVNCKPSWELRSELERELQLLAIADMVGKRADPGGFPTILAGDFDATPDSAGIRFLSGKQSLHGKSVHYRDAWLHGGDGTEGFTWTYRNDMAKAVIGRVVHQQRHERRIDYIFLGSPHDYARFARVRACRVALNKPKNRVWPSDHYGLYAEIDVVP